MAEPPINSSIPVAVELEGNRRIAQLRKLPHLRPVQLAVDNEMASLVSEAFRCTFLTVIRRLKVAYAQC